MMCSDILKILSWHLGGGTEKKHEKFRIDSRVPNHEPGQTALKPFVLPQQ
jgi:hypothetical protein